MAAVDKSNTEWGILMGGTGTDATVVDSGRLKVKAIGFAGNADNATCALTSLVGATQVSCAKFKTNGDDLDMSRNYIYFGEKGTYFTNLTATLSHADDRLYIYLV